LKTCRVVFKPENRLRKYLFSLVFSHGVFSAAMKLDRPVSTLLCLLLVGCIRTGLTLPPGIDIVDDSDGPDLPITEEEAAAAAASDEAALDTVVRFRGRDIDIAPHVAGFPYRGFRVYADVGTLLYFHETEEGRFMQALALDAPIDLTAGRQVSDIDWTTRSWGHPEPLPGRDALLVKADEDNAEFFDIYRMELADGALRKLTDVPYVYGYGVDVARDRFGYIARYPDEERPGGYRSCLELMSVDGGEATSVVCDGPELTFTWGPVRFAADGGRVWFNANGSNDRNRSHLVTLDLAAEAPAVQRVTEEAQRKTMWMLEDWLDDDTFVVINDESGFTNYWTGTASTGEMSALTSFEEVLNDGAVLRSGEEVRLIGSLRRPYESELLLMSPAGEVLARQVVEANLYGLGHHADSMWFYATSRSSKVEIVRLRLDGPDAFRLEPFIALPDELAGQLVHCDVERVSIPTFDVDPATGEPRQLHAYLSTPRVPPAEGEPRQVGVVAFYGGGNYFDTWSQILCQAGVAQLSPAVRGSWGFGAEFAALNDGDLGGDEIVDLHSVGRFLVERGYDPRHIGLYGGSHGGYATMRAMTFPPETNDRNSSFDWGWGVSFYGFSDIKTFWETCNIPDWVLLEAGDPATEPHKIRDRSPLAHVDRLASPLLLLHGENDQRVPVAESRQFAAACEAAGKDCEYLEFQGQGHGLKGVRNQTRVWKSVLGFLDRVSQ